MYKKIISLLLLTMLSNVFLFNVASAYTVVSKSDPYNIIANVAYNESQDRIYIVFDTNVITSQRVRTITRIIYNNSSFSSVHSTRTDSATNYYTSIFINCPGHYEFKLFNNHDESIGSIKISANYSDFKNTDGCDNPGVNPPEPPEPPTEPEPEPPKNPPNNDDDEECNVCGIFDCPGWDQYLGKLNQIANQAVGRLSNDIDNIVKNAVGDMSNVSTPDFGRAQRIPNIFDILNDVDKRNIPKPTGQEDSQLKNATFNANDIKNNATEIQFRDDPTGGFVIDNPLNTLPNGSDFPRPGQLEQIEYPVESENSGGNEVIQKPKNYDESIQRPQSPNENLTPPTTDETIETPVYDDTAKYPIP